MQESYSSMEASFQNLKQEFKAVFFEKDVLDLHDMFELETLLPQLVYQNSNYDIKTIFQEIEKQTVCIGYKAIGSQLDEKEEIGKVEEV